METLVAAALPVAVVTVLALAVIGAGTAVVSGALEALVAIETGATGVILRERGEGNAPCVNYGMESSFSHSRVHILSPFRSGKQLSADDGELITKLRWVNKLNLNHK